MNVHLLEQVYDFKWLRDKFAHEPTNDNSEEVICQFARAYILAFGSMLFADRSRMKFDFSCYRCYGISRKLDLSRGIASFLAAYIASYARQRLSTVAKLPIP